MIELKSEEIITYLILIIIGYFIAKIFSGCGNGFKIGGWPWDKENDICDNICDPELINSSSVCYAQECKTLDDLSKLPLFKKYPIDRTKIGNEPNSSIKSCSIDADCQGQDFGSAQCTIIRNINDCNPLGFKCGIDPNKDCGDNLECVKTYDICLPCKGFFGCI